jgi:GH15 family glucan-1,4-alpha-glucosidase
MEKIRDYAVIGDARSMALISKTGSLDWLCWPRFDSPPVFAGLLDPDEGQWAITPSGDFNISRRYIDDTPVLQTVFSSPGAEVVLTDLMSVASEEEKNFLPVPEREIVRKIECRKGPVNLQFRFCLSGRFPLVFKNKTLGIRARTRDGMVILRSDRDLPVAARSMDTTLGLQTGDKMYFSLTFTSEAPAVLPVLDEAPIERSLRWWKAFSAKICYNGPYRDVVVRSALVLKMLSYAPSAAIVAAPTTSLPEKVGGNLNWDYRFCWLRDASLTVNALMEIGYSAEADAFVNWLLHATHLTRPKLNVLYDVHGRRPQKEKTVPWRGYFGSRPVRFGNEASEQMQMDLYGEVISAANRIFRREKEIDQTGKNLLKELGDYICDHWREKDAGIWEIRGRVEHFTHSKVLCWAGLNALEELREKSVLCYHGIEKIKSVRDQIFEEIHSKAWNERLQTYTSTLDGDQVDADLFVLPWYKFVSYESPRMRKTYERIKERLSAPNGLFYRNKDEDEGPFLFCSLAAAAYLAGGGGT